MPENVPERRALKGDDSDNARNANGKKRSRTRSRHVRPGATGSGRLQLLYAVVVATTATLPTVVAQNCVSLADSTECRAFNSSSISTDSTLTGLFPFLANVSDTASFDSQLQQYVLNGFSQQRYQTLIGCSSYDSTDASDYYARYTTSVLCNAIVQNSISPCDLTGDATRPLCADTCAEYAESEESISASNLCGTTDSNATSQIRADFTNCALPADSLSGACIQGVSNEPDNCGYASNLGSLCSYCASSSPNSTDSCCVFSNTTSRCDGVVLPIVATSTMQPLFTSTSSATASPTNSTSAARRRKGLTGGQIAGVVIGSALGAFLLLALLILGCILFRRRRHGSPATSVFNQPVQARQGPPSSAMAFRNDGAQSQPEIIGALPGGRVARMAAMEANVSDQLDASPIRARRPFAATEATPESRKLAAPPPRRSGSLSSGSLLAFGNQDMSPGEAFSSPEGTTESEQLSLFKDYYSHDEMRPMDLVSALWAYQPRAPDEFSLERGDMLKVIGLWDDGWATGIRVRMRAADWKPEVKAQRDSGMSSGSKSPEEYGPTKAFPLVCVCLPQHWRRTIEGDSTEMGTLDDRPDSP